MCLILLSFFLSELCPLGFWGHTEPPFCSHGALVGLVNSNQKIFSCPKTCAPCRSWKKRPLERAVLPPFTGCRRLAGHSRGADAPRAAALHPQRLGERGSHASSASNWLLHPVKINPASGPVFSLRRDRGWLDESLRALTVGNRRILSFVLAVETSRLLQITCLWRSARDGVSIPGGSVTPRGPRCTVRAPPSLRRTSDSSSFSRTPAEASAGLRGPAGTGRA